MKRDASICISFVEQVLPAEVFRRLRDCGVDVNNLNCVQALPGNKYDITFKSVELRRACECKLDKIAGVVEVKTYTEHTVVTLFHVPVETNDNEVRYILNLYGEVLASRFCTYYFEPDCFNGNRQYKMKLRGNIPSALRIAGRNVWVAYPGQKKTCNRCGSTEHFVRECRTVMCNRCLATGHTASDCDSDIVCSVCHRKGHVSRNCGVSFANQVSKSKSWSQAPAMFAKCKCGKFWPGLDIKCGFCHDPVPVAKANIISCEECRPDPVSVDPDAPPPYPVEAACESCPQPQMPAQQSNPTDGEGKKDDHGESVAETQQLFSLMDTSDSQPVSTPATSDPTPTDHDNDTQHELECTDDGAGGTSVHRKRQMSGEEPTGQVAKKRITCEGIPDLHSLVLHNISFICNSFASMGCDIEAKTFPELREHCKRAHNEKGIKLFCPVSTCKSSSSTTLTWVNHLKNKHVEFLAKETVESLQGMLSLA
jgi:hypothetical protein